MEQDDLQRLREAVEAVMDNAPVLTTIDEEIVGNIGPGWTDDMIRQVFRGLYGSGAFDWDYDRRTGTLIVRMGYHSRDGE